MLNRLSITLCDGKGTTRSLYTNDANLVAVELQSNVDGKVIVRVTPLPSFDPNKHFLVQVSESASGKASKTSAVVLLGITPNWLNSASLSLSGFPDPRQFGALLVADANTRCAQEPDI